MSDPALISRFEELDAGRALGDLDAGEVKEWTELSETLGRKADLSLDLAASAVETEFLREREVSLPPEFAAILTQIVGTGTGTAVAGQSSAEESRADTADNIIRPPVAFWKRMVQSSEAAWAVAAVLTILFVINGLKSDPEPPAPIVYVVSSPTEISPSFAKETLLKKTSDLTAAKFGGVGNFEGMSGEVIWSDKEQEGYMTLANLPANNPSQKQYQLWIVDPARDKEPVDGGVFDIPSAGEEAVIPIKCPLTVRNPQAFVITLEQPGGVVVSEQDQVVALAKPS